MPKLLLSFFLSPLFSFPLTLLFNLSFLFFSSPPIVKVEKLQQTVAVIPSNQGDWKGSSSPTA